MQWKSVRDKGLLAAEGEVRRQEIARLGDTAEGSGEAVNYGYACGCLPDV